MALPLNRKPYTYLIGWAHLDRWYYGVRYGAKCHPSDFWVKYKTSSKVVRDFITDHGDPDVIEIRRVFDDPREAGFWEAKVLRRMKVASSNRWLNESEGSPNFHCKGHTPETRQKMSRTWKERGVFNIVPGAGAEGMKRKGHSAESRAKMSASQAPHNQKRAERMTRNNPMSNPASIQKMLKTRRMKQEMKNVSAP